MSTTIATPSFVHIRSASAGQRLSSRLDSRPPVETATTLRITAQSVYKGIGGGSFHDTSRGPDGELILTTGSVISHSSNLAQVAAAVQSAIRALCRCALTPDRVIGQVSHVLRWLNQAHSGHPILCKLFVGVVDQDRKALTFCNAGFPEPLVCSRSGKATALLPQSPPLGHADHVDYVATRVDLGPMSRLILFSEDLSEEYSVALAACGDEILRRVVEGTVDLAIETQIDAVLQTIKLHTSWEGQADGSATAMVVDLQAPKERVSP